MLSSLSTSLQAGKEACWTFGPSPSVLSFVHALRELLASPDVAPRLVVHRAGIWTCSGRQQWVAAAAVGFLPVVQRRAEDKISSVPK